MGLQEEEEEEEEETCLKEQEYTAESGSASGSTINW